MELGYQMRHPSHRFSTVMFNAISSTFMTTDIVTNGDSSLAKPERLCCHVTSLMLVCTAVLYLYYVRYMAECMAGMAHWRCKACISYV